MKRKSTNGEMICTKLKQVRTEIKMWVYRSECIQQCVTNETISKSQIGLHDYVYITKWTRGKSKVGPGLRER